MTNSMTAFASRTGAIDAVSWHWEMRGVNARGLDIRLRLPDAIEGLEAAVRSALTAALARGNVTITLRLTRDDAAQPMALDTAHLDRVLHALDTVQERAFTAGVTLGQPTAADVLNTRGVILTGRVDDDFDPAVRDALLRDLTVLIADFVAMRASEGAAIQAVLADQVSQIESLVAQATVAAEARRETTRANLTTALRRIMENAVDIDEARVAQELAILAVKSDITEEIDRLRAHVRAARTLLIEPKPAGRKFDFLAQEFNREANTLCAKAGAPALTTIGLDLKAVIDQLREQIQNVE